MTFWDHLDELRGTIFRSAFAVLTLSVAGLVFKDFLFGNVVLAPTRQDFCLYRLLGWNLDMKLVNVEISAQFFAHLRAALSAGLVAAVPYIIFQFWRFLEPALYAGEKRKLRRSFLMAGGLFYTGVAAGYFFVLPVCLQFFLNYSVSSEITNTITLSSYMSLFMSMVLLIGLVFEFPTLIAMLSAVGVVKRETLRKGRRYAVVGVLVLSALITPADPFSMLVLAAPLYLLYELSILLCKKGSEEE